MLNLGKELFNEFLKYLSSASSIENFRDYMVGLRVDKYNLLVDADKLFLNEFEGRYAEYSDFAADESLLKSSLVAFVNAEQVTSAPAKSWSIQSPEESNGCVSTRISSESPTATLI